MKPKQGAYVICLIFVALLTILIFLLPASTNLFVAYGFSLLSVALMAGGIAAFKANDVAGSIALLKQTSRHMPWTLLVSTIVLALQWAGIFTLPVAFHVLAQVVIFLLFSIRLVKVYTAKSYIENMDEKVAQNRANIAEWTSNVENVLLRDGLSAEAKQALKKVQDALRYSDPMSNDRVVTHNFHISELLVKLSATPEDNIPVICNQIIAQVNMRNSVLKSSK